MTCWLIIQNDATVLVHQQGGFPNDADVQPLLPLFIRSFHLGVSHAVDYHCAEIAEDVLIPESLQPISLKQALSLIVPQHYAMGVKAYSVIHWDRNHQFCGRCGAATVHNSKHFERFCTRCQLSFYPRISPSIIVLIYHKDQVLMARSPHFPPGVYGLIAGFVEIGETLEETVAREVKEEVGLNIKNISYFGSQPWPFPDSLMLAFTAEYDGGDLVIDNEEIEDAGWYRYDNLPGRPSLSISIASVLLDDFIQRSLLSEGL